MKKNSSQKRSIGASIQAHEPHDGILLVDKPAGPTSHDVVDDIRRRFQLDKVGHGGTLDPQATGLLLILTGRGTKLSNDLMGADKTYEGEATFGSSTTTQDFEGEVVDSADPSGLTEASVGEAMTTFVGDRMQTPPMVSAVKKDGVPLYKLARKGKTVDRPAKLIHIYDFTALDMTLPTMRFRISCTKGTYVRTVCHELGASLDCPAHLSALRRTRIGQFDLKDAATLTDILSWDYDQLVEHVLPVQKVLRILRGD